MIWVLGIILSAYCVLLIIFIIGWESIRVRQRTHKPPKDIVYSIVVPIRNEALNLLSLFHSLEKLRFPDERFEVILVDDHSEDNSKNIFDEYIKRSSLNIKWVRLDVDSGKKAALNKGILLTTGQVIVTTDGDCIVSSGWLETLDTYYQDSGTKMVFGPVAFHTEQTFFHHLQQIEFLSLVGAGAASLTLKIPNMCNGANLSFTKEVFEEIGGYKENEDIPSGDDEFLMHAIYHKYPNGVFFNKSEQALVNTYSLKDLTSFFSQRKRWSSKWRHYKNDKAKYMAMFIALTNVIIIYAFFYLLLSLSIPLGILIFIKIILEGLFIYRVVSYYKKPFKIGHFILLEICYPFYVVMFGLASNFGSYIWKGRRI